MLKSRAPVKFGGQNKRKYPTPNNSKINNTIVLFFTNLSSPYFLNFFLKVSNHIVISGYAEKVIHFIRVVHQVIEFLLTCFVLDILPVICAKTNISRYSEVMLRSSPSS